MRLTLAEIFGAPDHPYDEAHEFFEKKIEELSSEPALLTKMRGSVGVIDLQGKIFVLNRPLVLRNLQLVKICNGPLLAGPSFPQDEFLVRLVYSHGVQFVNLFFECSKRANGIHLEDFFRVRIEDCYLVHQKSYGIYSSPTGNNHELEIFKCHISEFLFGDGYPKKKTNYGVIPEFDVDANRVSTGIFLGQADNVVADCNINLCRVGIFSGMRANRIQGNHITGGGSRELELYRGIELNNFHKSSALIVNNYIDNCCLWINCTSDGKRNLRNYFHVTDNLFYRGYNHPIAGGEFSHIVINPMEPGSLIANLHICDNIFYNQPENLDGLKPRVLRPIRIACEEKSEGGEVALSEETPSLDHARLVGVSMKNNHFTNCFPTFVVPMGTRVTKIIDLKPGKQVYRVSFQDEIPLGIVRNAEASITEFSGKIPPRVTIKRIKGRSVVLYVEGDCSGTLSVTGSADGGNGNRYDYFVA